jgi:hypothetical protein
VAVAEITWLAHNPQAPEHLVKAITAEQVLKALQTRLVAVEAALEARAEMVRPQLAALAELGRHRQLLVPVLPTLRAAGALAKAPLESEAAPVLDAMLRQMSEVVGQAATKTSTAATAAQASSFCVARQRRHRQPARPLSPRTAATPSTRSLAAGALRSNGTLCRVG